jgi:hypothetical protein
VLLDPNRTSLLVQRSELVFGNPCDRIICVLPVMSDLMASTSDPLLAEVVQSILSNTFDDKESAGKVLQDVASNPPVASELRQNGAADAAQLRAFASQQLDSLVKACRQLPQAPSSTKQSPLDKLQAEGMSALVELLALRRSVTSAARSEKEDAGVHGGGSQSQALAGSR